MDRNVIATVYDQRGLRRARLREIPSGAQKKADPSSAIARKGVPLVAGHFYSLSSASNSASRRLSS
jgi:hypothetical protein